MGRKTVEVICKHCGDTFIAVEFYVKRGQYKYCSRKCMSEAQKGEGNPFYGRKHKEETKEHLSKVKTKMAEEGWKPHNVGQRKPDRVTNEKYLNGWRAIRKAVLVRDEYTCQLCMLSRAKDVHHIVPYRIVRDHTMNNLISLCKKCHKSIQGKEVEHIDMFLGILRRGNKL